MGPLYTTAFTDLFLSQLFSTRNQIESLVMIRSIATAEDIALPNDLSFLNLLLPERFLPVGYPWDRFTAVFRMTGPEWPNIALNGGDPRRAGGAPAAVD